MNWKKITPILLFVLLLAGTGGFFYYWKIWETHPEKWGEASYSPSDEYEIVEKGEERWVENKKEEISFKVPEGWRVEKEETYLALYAPDTQGSTRGGNIQNGCEIIIDVQHIKTSIKALREELTSLHSSWEYKDKYEDIYIDDKKALKNETGLPKLNLYGIGVHVPTSTIIRPKVYYLGLSSNQKDFEMCQSEFNEFLETVSIK